MKKQLFLLGLAVAAMTSCTNDEVLEMQSTQKVIGFDTFLNKGTRAINDIKSSELTKFKAFGYYNNGTETGENLWTNGVDVSKDGTTWSYDNSNIKYWTNNIYQFAGVADSETGGFLGNVSFACDENNDNAATLTITDYSVNNNKDLIADVVTVNNVSLTNADVSFTFEHLLSQVTFTITNTDQNGYSMKIVEPLTISCGDVATCTVLKDDIFWTFGNSKTTKTISPSNGVISTDYILSTNNTGSPDAHFVIPQDLDEVTYSIKVYFYDSNNQKVDEKTLSGTISTNSVDEWEPGYIYNYQIGLPATVKAITFGNISVNDNWTPINNIVLN